MATFNYNLIQTTRHGEVPSVENNANEKLWTATTKGNLVDIEESLSSGADINYCRNFFNACTTTVLGLAAFQGYYEVVTYLVECGASLYAPFGLYGTKLAQQLAKERGFHEIADYLLSEMRSSCNLNKTDAEGFTPLTYCIKNGHENFARKLIQHGADVCMSDGHGKTPLVHAIDRNSCELVQTLLEKGAGVCGFSALKYCMDLKRNQITKELLKHNPMLNDCVLSDRLTPLTKSLSQPNLNMAKFLLDNGADPNKKDGNNVSPLEQALRQNFLEMAEILVAKGAQVPRELDQNLLRQIVTRVTLDMFTFLLKNKWNINQFYQGGKTLLAYYAGEKNLLFTAFFVENGGNVARASREIEEFRRRNADFDFFMKQRASAAKKKQEQHWYDPDGAQE